MVDAILNRPAALKVPYRELLSDQSFVAQFRQDACLAARLDHPNIVRIHAIDQFTRFPLVS